MKLPNFRKQAKTFLSGMPETGGESPYAGDQGMAGTWHAGDCRMKTSCGEYLEKMLDEKEFLGLMEYVRCRATT